MNDECKAECLIHTSITIHLLCNFEEFSSVIMTDLMVIGLHGKVFQTLPARFGNCYLIFFVDPILSHSDYHYFNNLS